jgi:hypothetical protein
VYEDIKSWELKGGSEFITKYVILAYNKVDDVVKIYPCDSLEQMLQVRQYLGRIDLDEQDDNGAREIGSTGRYSDIQMYVRLDLEGD